MRENRPLITELQNTGLDTEHHENLQQTFANVHEVTASKGRYLGKGNFGEVFEFLLDDGSSIAVKFILPAVQSNNETKQLALIKKEINNNLGLKARLVLLTDEENIGYGTRVNTLTPIVLTDKTSRERFYGLQSDVAKFDLKQFLIYIATNSSLLNNDNRIFNNFKSSPLHCIELIVDRMRKCVLAMHTLNYLHLDVAARNYLIFGFQFDENGFLKDIDIKISDLGRAVSFAAPDNMCELPRDSAHPLRYLDRKAFKGHVNILSDIYALKVTIITMLDILMCGEIENTLYLKQYKPYQEIKESDLEYKRLRHQLSDTDVLRNFLSNAEKIAQLIIKRQKNLKQLNLQSERDHFRSVIAHGCLEFIEKYKPYLLQNMNENVMLALEEEAQAWEEVKNTKQKYYSISHGSENELKSSTEESENNSGSDSEIDVNKSNKINKSKKSFSSIDDYSYDVNIDNSSDLFPSHTVKNSPDFGITNSDEFPVDEIKTPLVTRKDKKKDKSALMIANQHHNKSSKSSEEDSGTESETEKAIKITTVNNVEDYSADLVTSFSNKSPSMTFAPLAPGLWRGFTMEDDFPKDEFKSPAVLKNRTANTDTQHKKNRQWASTEYDRKGIEEINEESESGSENERSKSKQSVEDYSVDISSTNSTASLSVNNTVIIKRFSNLSVEDSPLSSAEDINNPNSPKDSKESQPQIKKTYSDLYAPTTSPAKSSGNQPTSKSDIVNTRKKQP